MSKSKQNRVPYEFDSLYSPILQLKRLLQSNAKELSPDQTLQGFIMLHFATFVMVYLFKQRKVSPEKALNTRGLIELILAADSHQMQADELSRLFSFIDALGKELNTTAKAYVYIAMYQAYLDAEIYRHFHADLGIYDFIEFQYVRPETVAGMKNYHDVSVKVIEEVNAVAKARGLFNPC